MLPSNAVIRRHAARLLHPVAQLPSMLLEPNCVRVAVTAAHVARRCARTRLLRLRYAPRGKVRRREAGRSRRGRHAQDGGGDDCGGVRGGGRGPHLEGGACPGLSGEDLRARVMRSAPEPPGRSSSRRAGRPFAGGVALCRCFAPLFSPPCFAAFCNVLGSFCGVVHEFGVVN